MVSSSLEDSAPGDLKAKSWQPSGPGKPRNPSWVSVSLVSGVYWDCGTFKPQSKKPRNTAEESVAENGENAWVTCYSVSGVCLGMQCAVIEFARNVLKWEGAHSTEVAPATKYPVVSLKWWLIYDHIWQKMAELTACCPQKHSVCQANMTN